MELFSIRIQRTFQLVSTDGEVHHPQKKGAGDGEKGTYGCLDNLRWLHNCRFFCFLMRIREWRE